MKVTVDASEVRAYEAKLASAGSASKGQLAAVVSKGALNIKQDLQAELRGSGNAGFRHVASTVSYDLEDGGMTAVVGPTKPSGALANIAYFGSWKGGGTREDPRVALEAEVPRFQAALLALVDGLL